MTNENVTIELTKEQMAFLAKVQKNYEKIQFLLDCKVFEVKNGTIYIEADINGIWQDVDVKMKLGKRKKRVDTKTAVVLK